MNGEQIWCNTETGGVAFGVQGSKCVYAACRSAGYGGSTIKAIDKDTGTILSSSVCSSSTACCLTADESCIFDAAMLPLPMSESDRDSRKLGATTIGRFGLAYSMLSQQCLGNELVLGINKGFRCYDVSDGAISGDSRSPRSALMVVYKVGGSNEVGVLRAEDVRVADSNDSDEMNGKVLCTCVKEGGKLRVRVDSPGYDSSWNCQFPKSIRVEGARYAVDNVQKAPNGNFYRALGEIVRIGA